MKRLVLISIITILGFVNGLSATGENFKMTVEAPQFKNQFVLMGYYYNGKTYASDSIAINDKGIGILKKDEKIPEGIYFFYSSTYYYEFIMAKEQIFSVKLDTASTANHLTFKGNPQATEFEKYKNFLTHKRTQLDSELAVIDSADTQKRDAISKKISTEVTTYQKSIIEKYPNSMISTFINGLIDIEIPESIKQMPDSTRGLAQYQYYKKHYFDNVPFDDVRILRTPYFSGKVSSYFNNVLIQNPDSVVEPVCEVVEKSRLNDTIYRVIAFDAFNYAYKSQIMVMDKVTVELYDRFFHPDQEFFADSAFHESLGKEVEKWRKNLIGSHAYNMNLTSLDGHTFNLYDIENEYVLVYFFEPSCGHCKKTTPQIFKDVYPKYKDKGFSMVCIYLQTDKEEWVNFLNEHQLYGENWINAWDPNRVSYYWQFFDTSTTPGLYLYDKNWKLVAKKISPESLDGLLDYELIKNKEK